MRQNKHKRKKKHPPPKSPSHEEKVIGEKAESIPIVENLISIKPAIPLTPVTSDDQKQEAAMEIHHHGHVPHEKKWKDYTFQFFMLFLAVFCSFLAEYQLEHVIENNREKQFMQSLIMDLSDDRASINSILKRHEERSPMMDSLIRLLNSDNIREHTADVYYFGRIASRGFVLSYNNRTIDQMRNSGGFRLVRIENVADSIMGYYSALSHVKMLEETDLSEQNQYRTFAVKVFDGGIMQSIIGPESTVMKPSGNPPLRNYDKTVLGDMAGWVHYMNNTRVSICSELELIKMQGIRLVELIKREYHLE